MKWNQIVLVITIILCIVGLGVVSVVSFFQTETAFRGLNDSSIVGLGLFISIAFAFVFQYGQNAALYIRKKFATGKKILTLFTWDITDSTILMIIFWIFAAVDALTNIVWFYRTVENNPDPFLNVVVKILGYSAMLLAVFVEEVFGVVMDALSRAIKELKSILEWEKKNHSEDNNVGIKINTHPQNSMKRPTPSYPSVRQPQRNAPADRFNNLTRPQLAQSFRPSSNGGKSDESPSRFEDDLTREFDEFQTEYYSEQRLKK